MDNFEEEMADKIKEFGFITHLVMEGDPSSPTGFNIHTHGMENFNHLDFQIIIPMEGSIAHSIFHTLVAKVKKGTKFLVEEIYSGIIKDYSITFILAKETDREVLRVILPDPEGNLSKEDINERFAIQYS